MAKKKKPKKTGSSEGSGQLAVSSNFCVLAYLRETFYRMKVIGNRNVVTAMFSVVAMLFSVSSIHAQKLTVQVSANKVQVGAAFQVVFTVNAQPTTYTPPNFNGFDVFSGPNVSQSTQIMNGNMSQQFMISF